MDESLSDFQDKKIVNTGPKSVKTTVVKKKKGRKPFKRQTDIRTLVKSGKGALLSYATEFDNVCKQSGVDVDSEQLQLAIALSKSIQEQDVAYVCEDCQELKESTSRGITKAIRITLQEYGFKSSKLQNTVSVKKRKRYRKEYKLLLITDTARQQIISDKYAEVLLRNECESNCKTQFDNLSNELYFKATNILYEYIKNDNLFYCIDIFQKSLHKSYMLKDWSDIPGRISSPKKEVINFNLDNVEFSQNELDCILSGSVKMAQDIVNYKINKSKEVMEELEITAENEPINKTSSPIKLIDLERSSSVEFVMEKTSNKDNWLYNLNSETSSSLPIRSISPDLFEEEDDDDKPSKIDQSNNDVQVIDNIDKTKYDNTNYMDLTECVVPANINIHKSTRAGSLQLEANRNFHDIMELTDCVPTNTKHAFESIDLTQNQDEKKIGTVHPKLEKCVETMDLTQSSDSNDDLPIIQISGKEIGTSLENQTVVLDEVSNSRHTLDTPENRTANSSLDYVEENEKLSDKYSNGSIDINMTTGICVGEISECEPNNILIHHTINIESDSSTLNLTQNVNSANGSLENTSIKVVDTKIMNEGNGLGKINEVSIDYDDLFDSINARKDLSKNVSAMSEENQKIMEPGDITTIFDSPDENPNILVQTAQNIEFGAISVMDDVSDSEITKNSAENDATNKSGANNTDSQKNCNKINATPLRTKRKSSIETPKNNEYIIKTNNITPMLDYESMSSPERNKELDKYGIKPFKRKRAIQLLTHIYNQTHPIVEQCSSEELSMGKVQKRNFYNSPQTTSHSQSPRKTRAVKTTELNKESIYQETKDYPDIRNIQCNAEDWVFQKREKTKEHSCRVPLHVAFHNYVSCRKLLGEAILCYEPVNIDIIHKDLVGYGYRYNPKDLLKFLDKKCITVKTMDSTRTKKL